MKHEIVHGIPVTVIEQGGVRFMEAKGANRKDRRRNQSLLKKAVESNGRK